LKHPRSSRCPAPGVTKADVDHPAILAQRLRLVGADPPKISGREGGSLEFKESFNWSGKEAYSKTLAALANNAGGYIVFGVKNKPRVGVGLLTDPYITAPIPTLREHTQPWLSDFDIREGGVVYTSGRFPQAGEC
jgi:hypothetical protein